MEGQSHPHNEPVTVPAEPAPKRRRANPSENRPKRAPRKQPPSLLVYDEETKEHRLELRSSGPRNKCKTLRVVLSQPDQDEECSIAMEPIREYRLPFLSDSACVWEHRPDLAKASLPCGHAFSALALLYHFAKNAMTCPCCRAGHDKTVLADASIPTHLRRAFTRHLLEERSREVQEQIAEDARIAVRAVQAELANLSSSYVNMRVTRLMLSVTAWDTLDMDASGYPGITLQIPLSSSLTPEGMVFESYGYNLHHLNLNMRLLPYRAQAFEMAVICETQFGFPVRCLFRTARVAHEAPGTRVLFGTELGPDGTYPSLQVETAMFSDGIQVFYRVRWTTRLHVFAAMLGA